MGQMVFTLGGDTFTFATGRCYPIHDPAKVNVVVDYSEGMKLYAYDKGVAEQFFTLDLVNIDATTAANVSDWIENICVGPKNTFTFTDEDGTDHTVRCMNTEDPMREMANDAWSGVLTLRKEI
jgi:hypothetical protein